MGLYYSGSEPYRRAALSEKGMIKIYSVVTGTGYEKKKKAHLLHSYLTTLATFDYVQLSRCHVTAVLAARLFWSTSHDS